ncbi:MAG: FtsX-like permease family protein [Acidobacteria bacterium]|nr:FtsX-like permease family protein [Acidobacteriota bacterium]
MSRWRVFYRLLGRPLLHDPVRTGLTVLAVALGVAVVVAIDLAGEASAGSFRSSMETLTGQADLEVTAVGGFDERLLGDLVRLPHNLAFSPRVEGFARVMETGATVPVFGLDLVGDATLERAQAGGAESTFDFEGMDLETAVWAGEAVAAEPGRTLRLQINDRVLEYRVAGVLRGEGFQGVSVRDVVILDIAAAQRALGKLGRLDRVQVYEPEDESADWPAVLRAALPEGAEVVPIGSAAEENRKMLGAFRWNLRVLSYLSLIVGAFLIYNTIAVSVVRRRPEIGVLRALGATRGDVRLAFLAEAAVLGAAGTVVGLALGRILANGAVELMSLTVQTLYVTSAPGRIVITPARLLTAAVAGVGVALLSAWLPAKEAAAVAPTEAMARGRRDFEAGRGVGRRLAWGGLLALLAALASLAPPVGSIPVFGYLAAVLLLAASALAARWFVRTASGLGTRLAFRLFGIEGFLGSRSVAAALGRTAVLVGALSTATAMLVSIGVMVGSFRETVLVWMDRQLRADLFLRPAGDPATDRYATMDAALADAIEALPEVAAVDRFRAYPIRYDGMPANLGAGDARLHGERAGIRFLEGGDARQILSCLPTGPYVVVSEPFARKHDVWTGDHIRLPLGGREVDLENLGVFYDYTSERGAVIIDRKVLMQYLPDPAVSSLAVYLEPGADAEAVRDEIVARNPGRELYIATNGRLRTEAIAIFDRTFAITWALEAVAVTVAVLGMAGALLALVIDRKREIAVLRFLGASAGQIRKLILTESGLLGLLSITLGTALGTALSLVLIYVINKQSFGWTIQFHWPVGLLLAALTGVYLASVAAGLYPARLAARLNPIEAAHEE